MYSLSEKYGWLESSSLNLSNTFILLSFLCPRVADTSEIFLWGNFVLRVGAFFKRGNLWTFCKFFLNNLWIIFMHKYTESLYNMHIHTWIDIHSSIYTKRLCLSQYKAPFWLIGLVVLRMLYMDIYSICEMCTKFALYICAICIYGNMHNFCPCFLCNMLFYILCFVYIVSLWCGHFSSNTLI